MVPSCLRLRLLVRLLVSVVWLRLLVPRLRMRALGSACARLCLTEVDDIPAQADTFFPDYSDWQVVNKEAHPKDERHVFEYAFTDYERTR